MEDRYLNFYHYVVECIDEEDFPPDYEICRCEHICTSCKFFELFGDECPCALAITCIGYDDKGKQIVASCSRYENTLQYRNETSKDHKK